MIGHGYRLFASPGAPRLADQSINISYLEDDLLPGTEGGIGLYFWDEAAKSWARISTALVDIARNEVTAAARGPGLYALMSSVDMQVGWNLLAYPWAQTLPVKDALVSLNGEGFYTTVYGYDETDTDDPWKVYDLSAPGWVNDLNDLQYGHGYWVNVITPTSPAPNQSAAVRRATGAAQESLALSLPPATYYGVAPWSRPNDTLEIQAMVNDTLCGESQTRMVAGQALPVFAIDVRAAGAGDDSACGTVGQLVTLSFSKGGHEVGRAMVVWDNNRVQALQISVMYLPLLNSGATSDDPPDEADRSPARAIWSAREAQRDR